MTDHKAKGAADYAAQSKDEVLFHDASNAGRLYREGWHVARRAAEAAAACKPDAGAPAAGCPTGSELPGLGCAPDRARAEPPCATDSPLPAPPCPPAPASCAPAGTFCDACGLDKPGQEGRVVNCAPAAGLWVCDDCLKEGEDRAAAALPPTFPGDPLSAHRDGVAASQLADLPSLPEPIGQTTLLPGVKEPEQLSLLDVDPEWKRLWTGMPEFRQDDLSPWASLPVHFASRADRDAFAKLIGQTITDDTRSVWFPKAEIGRYADRRYTTTAAVNPRYPVYIPTKGRSESALTIKSLEKMRVPYFAVIQPQELPLYEPVVGKHGRILLLPAGLDGLVPARNWIKDHATASGAARHWQIDDNIDGFFRLNRNLKVPADTGAIFRAMEDFSDRFENVAISGPNYFMFASRKTLIPPITLNTRVYSCSLISNSIPHRYRDVFNDDTDICIRALKDGLCTILFNAFLCCKARTMTIPGGNTPIYQGDGRLKMAESLKRQHPEIVTITRKWGRWQHHVDYSPFKGNKLAPRAGFELPSEANNYGMELEMLEGSK